MSTEQDSGYWGITVLFLKCSVLSAFCSDLVFVFIVHCYPFVIHFVMKRICCTAVSLVLLTVLPVYLAGSAAERPFHLRHLSE